MKVVLCDVRFIISVGFLLTSRGNNGQVEGNIAKPTYNETKKITEC